MYLLVNWANSNQGFSQLVSSTIIVIITVIYVSIVKKQADEAKRQADLILMQNLYQTHQEMVREVYGPVIEWLDKLSEEFILESYIFDFDGAMVTWEEFKKKLSPLIYRMKETYLSKITDINSLFKSFRNNLSDSERTMKTLVAEVIQSELNIEYKPRDVRVLSLVDVLGRDLFRTVFSENYLTSLLAKAKEKGDIVLELVHDNGNVADISLPEIRFSNIACRIRGKMMQNVDLNSKITLYNQIRKESRLLMMDIEKEARKSEADLVREYGIVRGL